MSTTNLHHLRSTTPSPMRRTDNSAENVSSASSVHGTTPFPTHLRVGRGSSSSPAVSGEMVTNVLLARQGVMPASGGRISDDLGGFPALSGRGFGFEDTAPPSDRRRSEDIEERPTPARRTSIRDSGAPISGADVSSAVVTAESVRERTSIAAYMTTKRETVDRLHAALNLDAAEEERTNAMNELFIATMDLEGAALHAIKLSPTYDPNANITLENVYGKVQEITGPNYRSIAAHRPDKRSSDHTHEERNAEILSTTAGYLIHAHALEQLQAKRERIQNTPAELILPLPRFLAFGLTDTDGIHSALLEEVEETILSPEVQKQAQLYNLDKQIGHAESMRHAIVGTMKELDRKLLGDLQNIADDAGVDLPQLKHTGSTAKARAVHEALTETIKSKLENNPYSDEAGTWSKLKHVAGNALSRNHASDTSVSETEEGRAEAHSNDRNAVARARLPILQRAFNDLENLKESVENAYALQGTAAYPEIVQEHEKRRKQAFKLWNAGSRVFFQALSAFLHASCAYAGSHFLAKPFGVKPDANPLDPMNIFRTGAATGFALGVAVDSCNNIVIPALSKVPELFGVRPLMPPKEEDVNPAPLKLLMERDGNLRAPSEEEEKSLVKAVNDKHDLNDKIGNKGYSEPLGKHVGYHSYGFATALLDRIAVHWESDKAPIGNPFARLVLKTFAAQFTASTINTRRNLNTHIEGMNGTPFPALVASEETPEPGFVNGVKHVGNAVLDVGIGFSKYVTDKDRTKDMVDSIVGSILAICASSFATGGAKTYEAERAGGHHHMESQNSGQLPWHEQVRMFFHMFSLSWFAMAIILPFVFSSTEHNRKKERQRAIDAGVAKENQPFGDTYIACHNLIYCWDSHQTYMNGRKTPWEMLKNGDGNILGEGLALRAVKALALLGVDFTTNLPANAFKIPGALANDVVVELPRALVGATLGSGAKKLNKFANKQLDEAIGKEPSESSSGSPPSGLSSRIL